MCLQLTKNVENSGIDFPWARILQVLPPMNHRYSDAQLLEAARLRARGHNGKAHIRPLVASQAELGHWWTGLVGERAFAERFGLGLRLDYVESASDSGVDFVLPSGYTVDVKTASRPYGLWVEVGHVDADIFVLAVLSGPGEADLLGWAWAREVRQAPIRVSRHGVRNHCLGLKELHKWDD